MLHKKLLLMPSSLDEQKKLIRYLIHLEVAGDPAWDCIINAQNWLVNLMHRCKQEQLDKEDEENKDLLRANMLSPSSSQSLNRGINFKSGGKAPQRVVFVELLTKVLCDNVPDLWRLGQSYLNGKLLKEVKKIGRADATKQAQFKLLVEDLINVYARLIRAAFLAQTLSSADKKSGAYGVWKDRKQDSALAWLPVCVRHVRMCIVLLGPLELPPESIGVLQLLAFDLRWHCLCTLLKQAIQDVESLQERETWIIDTDDKRGGTTMLPVQFENVVSETIHTLLEVVNVQAGEKQLFQEVSNQKEASELCIVVLQAFASTLNTLADQEDTSKLPPKSVANKVLPLEALRKGHGDTAFPSLDKRLIIVLSNCALTVNHVIPRLVDNLTRHSYPNTPRILQVAQGAYRKVDEQLFRKYIEVKSNPIIGALEQNMFVGSFDWTQCPPPTGVRNYVKECVMSLLEVHAEVYSIGPTFVDRVMRSIVYNVAEELTRLLQCVTKFSVYGVVQANVDVAAFDVSIEVFKIQETRNAVQEALKCVSSVSACDKKRVAELLEKFKEQMHFHLMCFQPEKRLK
jgi:exocyst complex component 2